MTCKKYLDYCIQNYYSKIFVKNNFRQTDSNSNDNFALHIYTGNFYILKITCDRQLIEAEVSSLHNADKFIYIDDLYIHIKLLQSGDKKINAWDLKMITSKHLSAEEQTEFLDKDHELITMLLDKKNNQETLKNILESAHKKYNYPKYKI